jgi:hypothetical protein
MDQPDKDLTPTEAEVEAAVKAFMAPRQHVGHTQSDLVAGMTIALRAAALVRLRRAGMSQSARERAERIITKLRDPNIITGKVGWFVLTRREVTDLISAEIEAARREGWDRAIEAAAKRIEALALKGGVYSVDGAFHYAAQEVKALTPPEEI